jgi:hypothetical protein
MINAEDLFSYGEEASVQRLGLGIAALRLVKHREVVETDADIRMLRTNCLLLDGEGACAQRLGLGIAALRPLERREVVETGADSRMLRAECLLADGEGACIAPHRKFRPLSVAVATTSAGPRHQR